MALHSTEKASPATEHHETDKLDIHTDISFAELAAEEVHYGYSGARAFLSSPYVFGAALLASMGGFSYGYGMSLLALSCPMRPEHIQRRKD